MKYDFLILSSLPLNSGCYLRAKYLAQSLEQNNAVVKLIKPFHSKSFLIGFALNFIKYFFVSLFTSYKTGIAIKPYPNALIPLLIKKLIVRNQVIVDVDDIDFGYRDGLMSTISRWLQKPFPKYCNMITFHNQLLKQFIIDEYGVKEEKLYKLLQGVDFNVFDYKKYQRSFQSDFRKQYHIQKSTSILIYTAHLNIASDLNEILTNISPILEKYNCFLIIAGGGPQLDHYIQFAQKLKITNIYFTGYLSPEMIKEYALISNYSLVYYKDKKVNYYRSSMKIREQLALKKKIICNDVGELKLFAKYTYQSKKSIKDYMTLIEKILKNSFKDKREESGYSYILKNFNWNNIGEKLIKHLKSL